MANDNDKPLRETLKPRGEQEKPPLKPKPSTPPIKPSEADKDG